MNYTLRKRTAEEIDAIKSQHRFYSKMVKGDSFIEVCPLEITLSTSGSMEVWALSEDQIISLIDDAMKEMTPKGMKDQVKVRETWDILSCWRDKHDKVSVDFIEDCLKMEDNYKDYVGTVRDFTTPFIYKKLEEAKIIADYLNGMSGDKKVITNENYIKILRNQEQIRENRNSKSANL